MNSSNTPRKDFGTSKCPRRHDGNRSVRPKIARDPRKSAHFNRTSTKLQTQNNKILIEAIQG